MSVFGAIRKLRIDHPESRIQPEKLPAIHRAALASSAFGAHVNDGVASDPRHCLGGEGANSFGQYIDMTPALRDDPKHNIMEELQAWVEQGVVPNEIIAAKFVDDNKKNGVAFTR